MRSQKYPSLTSFFPGLLKLQQKKMLQLRKKKSYHQAFGTFLGLRSQYSNSGTSEDSTEDDIDGSDNQSSLIFFREEEHLELFYLASFLFLSFLLYHIMKKNVENSRKRARVLQELQKMRRETGELEKSHPTLGVLRQISFH